MYVTSWNYVYMDNVDRGCLSPFFELCFVLWMVSGCLFLPFVPGPFGPVGSLWGGGCGRQGTSRVSYVNEDLAAGTYDIACFLEHRPQQPWQGLYRALPGQYVLCFVFF